jgi:hypothetical protein
MAWPRETIFSFRETFSGGHPELKLDEIVTGHLFRYRMLDLDAGVHLHEVEVLVLVDKELDGTGVLVVDGLATL